jgi:PAS domain S-box-containing protein
LETTGHVLIGQKGELLSVNDAFCDIIGAPEKDLVGRAVSDLTALADREECGIAIDRLRKTGRTFNISKRFIRADFSLVWVTNTVSLLRVGSRPPVIMASIVPIADPAQYRSPAQLMRCARFMISARSHRRKMFSQALLSDPGWDVLLGLYVAEGEGTSLTGQDIMVSAGLGEQLLTRWVAILAECHLIEIERDHREPEPGNEMAQPLRLTALAHKKIEDYLAKLAIQQREFITA